MFSETSPPLPWDDNHVYTRDSIKLYYQVCLDEFNFARVNPYFLLSIMITVFFSESKALCDVASSLNIIKKKSSFCVRAIVDLLFFLMLENPILIR